MNVERQPFRYRCRVKKVIGPVLFVYEYFQILLTNSLFDSYMSILHKNDLKFVGSMVLVHDLNPNP